MTVIIKDIKKDSEKKHVKDIKMFLKKKKKKGEKKLEIDIEIVLKNLSEEKKQKLVEYRRNYYFTHNK